MNARRWADATLVALMVLLAAVPTGRPAAQLAHAAPRQVTIGVTFNHPAGVAVDGSGNVYVADYGNNRVERLVAGTWTTIGSGFINPWGVAVDGSGNVYVADTYNGRIERLAAGTWARRARDTTTRDRATAEATVGSEGQSAH
jgi:sugar lactone lactonase YvrE